MLKTFAALTVAVAAGLLVMPVVAMTRSTTTTSLAAIDPSSNEPSPSESASQDVVGRAVQRDPRAGLNVALDAYTAGIEARFAVAVFDNRNGLSYAYNADETFKTASVVKVDILAALLVQAADQGRSLTAHEWDLASAMIESSDNDAASALWWEIGGAAGMAAFDERIGLFETVPGTGGWWGETTTTVTDRIRLLTAMVDPDGPLAAYQDDILSLMGAVVADQSWGVSAAASTGEVVELKNGWVDDDQGLWMINSVGRLTGPDTDLSIVVLSDGQAGYSAGIAVVQQIAQLARTQLGW